MAVDVAAAAAMRATVVAEDVAAMGVAAAVGYDHCRGACPSACLAGLVRGLHPQPQFCCCPHGQRPVRGLKRSAALGLTETSPPEQAQLPGLSNQNIFALHTDESRLGNGKSGYPIQ